jgi:cytochrome b-561
MHALIQIIVLILVILGLKAVFNSHNDHKPPIPNMYSLHSWVGLTAVILFGLQWVMGFVSFLFPKLSDNLRRSYLPHHKFWGVTIFGICCGTALMGITEKAIFSVKKYSFLVSNFNLLDRI